MNGKRKYEIIFTYGLSYVAHILAVLLHRKGAVGPSAVNVIVISFVPTCSDRVRFGKSTKAKRIYYSSLVALTSNELSNSRPDLDC